MTAKTGVMVICRTPKRCTISLNGTVLRQVDRFKYLGVEFASNGRQDGEIDRRISSASSVLRALNGLVMRSSLSREARLAVFRTVYRPILTYGHEQWAMTAKVRSRVQAAEMRFLRRTAGVSL